jgi:fucose 4-O-acetylase-like acetyltransferase
MSGGGRDVRLDVAKGALITLVVLGHFLPVSAGPDGDGVLSGWSHEPQGFLLVLIYLFHMPLFVLLAGVTAKRSRLAERVLRLAVLLVVLEVLYVVPLWLVTGDPQSSTLAPFFVLWFLLAMIWWMLMLPLVERFPRAAVAVSVGAAVLVGLVPLDGDELTYSRTLVFLPFFVVGHLHGARLLRATAQRPPAVRVLAAAVLLAVVMVVWLRSPQQDWLGGNGSFETLGTADGRGVAVRAALLLASAVCCVAALTLVPAHDGLWALLGRRSLAIFLLHPGAVILASPVLQAVGEDTNGVVMVGVCVVLTAATVAVLALPVFDRVLRHLSETVAGAVLALARPRTVAGPG